MYEKMYLALLDAIRSQRFKAGDRVPSEKELAEQYGVSRITSKKALEMLASDGVIIRKPGRGSFVAERGQAPSEASAHAAVGIREPAETPPLIGLVLADFADSYGTGLVSGIERAAAEREAFVVLRRSFGDHEKEKEAIRALLRIGVDGLIVFPAHGEHFNAEILKLVVDEFPLVLIDRYLKGVGAASIHTDNVAAARMGTDHLLDLGHRHIGLVSVPPLDTTAVEDRVDGFIQAHAERGVAVDKSIWLNDVTSTLPNSFNPPNIAKDIAKIKDYLRRNGQITAVFAIEYNIALLVKAAAEELGLRIPQDLSILCFDSPPDPFGKHFFTHLLQDQEEMGRLAMDCVLKLKNGEPIQNRQSLPASLVVGQSTGPCAR
jgi:DNA-binding LacI/PurR family transcriptional regulator